MNILTQEEINSVSGGNAVVVLTLIGAGILIVAMEAYLIEQVRFTHEFVDLATLSSQEAYGLGMIHALSYCNYHCF